ncbi:cytochrome P450 family protein [Streptomyces sp. JNUCC 64]
MALTSPPSRPDPSDDPPVPIGDRPGPGTGAAVCPVAHHGTPAGDTSGRRNSAAGAPPADVVGRLLDDPFAGYAELRATAPVHRITGPDGTPAWLVTRYEDVRTGLADPRLSLDKGNGLPGGYHGFRLPPVLDSNLLNMDPPDHTRVRRLVSRAFTPRRIERLREPVRRTAHRLVDAFEPAGRADLIGAYAAPLPITVICDLLGVPEGNRPDFRAWTEALLGPERPEPAAAKAAVTAMADFYTRLIADKRRDPGDDLVSALIAVRDDAVEPGPGAAAGVTGNDRLSEDELVSLVFLLHFAGYENAVHLIGNAVLNLLSHPEEYAALRADPVRLPTAVEELSRFDSPMLVAMRRFPLEDVEISGVTVPAGETVLLSPASANRDPDRFPDPDRLDLSRDASGQLSLGHGIHYCLGASLARLEVEVALGTLFERLPGLALDGDPETFPRRRGLRTRGLRELPVRF